ncbi:MAG TPA: tRNA pseudouridine(38-40) synthase TruA [Pyrinomonadaceae bacterium]|nr:tRNA pseudouridine(38-40) synthase TruA [Pyrinomonadaceae bacterium]
MNYKLLLQYDGTDFHGWQIQEGRRTVQGELTHALSLIDGRSVNVHGSGRTDAGVHAEGQVASVQIQREITPTKLRAAINGNLGRDVRVLSCEVVSDDFHARYSALEKTYVYRIVNGPVISPFWWRYAHHDARPLDHEKMAQTAELFGGEHDWTAFSAAQSDVEDRVRTVTRVEIHERPDERSRDSLIEIRVSANGFLRYMVRAMAGTLMAAGRGELDRDAIKVALETGTRPLAAVTAPACGLTLLSVRYNQTAGASPSS